MPSISLSGPSRRHTPSILISGTCRRPLMTSASLFVKRPQKPYPVILPYMDAHGYPNASVRDKSQLLPLRLQMTLGELAEARTMSHVERYGNQDGFGLKVGARPNGSEGVEELEISASTSKSSSGDWVRDLGFSTFRGSMRKRKATASRDHFRSGGYARERAASVDGTSRGRSQGGKFGLKPKPKPEMAWSGRGGRSKPPHLGSTATSHEATTTTDDGKSFPSPQMDSPMSERIPNSSWDRRAPTVDVPSRVKIPMRSPRPKHSSPSTDWPSARAGASRSYRTAARFGFRNDSASDDEPIQPRAPKPLHRREQTIAPSDLEPENIASSDGPLRSKVPWQPTKKITFSAMAGLKALHRADPDKFTRAVLSERFGISFEAVRRILRSAFREREAELEETEARPATRGRKETTLKGTKWDQSPLTSETYSPVPAIMRAYQKSSRRPKSVPTGDSTNEKGTIA